MVEPHATVLGPIDKEHQAAEVGRNFEDGDQTGPLGDWPRKRPRKQKRPLGSWPHTRPWASHREVGHGRGQRDKSSASRLAVLETG